jgi:hypothetical protein
MDILERILTVGLPVLAVLVVFAVAAYAEALRHARRG